MRIANSAKRQNYFTRKVSRLELPAPQTEGLYNADMLNLNHIAMRVAAVALGFITLPAGADDRLWLHLPLTKDAADQSPANRQSASTGLVHHAQSPQPGLAGWTRFNGRDSKITIPDAPPLGDKPFEISLWVNADNLSDRLAGDLVSHYDPVTRTGFHLGIYTHGGVTNSQPNTRQLHFGIDQGQLEKGFTDHGRLGEAVYIFAMCVHKGKLYAATCCAGKEQAGHVFRFEGGTRWTDLGSPDRANAISAMAVYDDRLYVASSKYRLAGSSLSESENPNSGGQVFCLVDKDDEVTWENCGRLSPATEAVASLVVYQGRLFASSLYKPAAFFRYEGNQNWTALEVPQGKRVEALTVMQQGLFATSYDEGAVFRFDGHQWSDVGKIPQATQTYGFGVYRGQLYVSEWPQAHVYRYAGGRDWIDCGKLGTELEAMPLLVYNGKMYGGTLPSAQVFRYEGDTQWSLIGQVDHTPDVKYRRAWSMAVYQGRLFVGTLPSGHVHSIQAGANATWDHEFPPGWHHVRAVRLVDRLELHVDGQLVAQSPSFSHAYNLTNTQPLEIGFGAQQHFDGGLAEIKILGKP